MKRNTPLIVLLIMACFSVSGVLGQSYKTDSAWQHSRKNIIRYNMSSALLFGFGKSVILGYERVLKPNQSISINFGSIALPKLTDIKTDSFSFNKDLKNSGFNVSLDYRFYLAKENKYRAPRGIYIGPWYSFNRFIRDNSWKFTNSSSQTNATTNVNFNIHSFGVELGYQFVFWDRLALDLVMIGPGMGLYNVNAKYDTNLTPEEKEQLQQVINEILKNKFPGMDYVLGDKELKGNGVLNVTSLGYRYIIHIGFRF